MKKLIDFTEQRFTEELTYKEQYAALVQPAVDAFHRLGIGQLTNADQLSALLANPQDLCFRMMAEGKDLTFLGFKVKRSQVQEMVELPEGFAQLQAVIDGTPQSLTTGNQYSASIYDVTIQSGKVMVKPEVVKALRDKYSLFASNPTEAEAAELAKGIHEMLAKFHGKFGYNLTKQLLSEHIKLSSFGDTPPRLEKLSQLIDSVNNTVYAHSKKASWDYTPLYKSLHSKPT